MNIPLRKIGVLMGGTSSEREVSLRTGKAVLAALERSSFDCVAIDLTDKWPEAISAAGIDTAFIALHGTLGEDGCVQGLLEIMGIPYTGSGVTASGLCMHKPLTKAVLEKAGVSTPIDVPLTANGPIRYPVILKPIAEGSSVGLYTLNGQADWDALQQEIGNDIEGWMAEMPLEGPEIHVSVLDGKALPPVEVVPKSGVYDYHSKYTAGATEYFCPARLPAETMRHCMQLAEQAVKATACSGAPRVDMIVDKGGQASVLEVNTLPGMTETSLLPKAAAAAGIDFDELCCRILATASLHAKGVEA